MCILKSTLPNEVRYISVVFWTAFRPNFEMKPVRKKRKVNKNLILTAIHEIIERELISTQEISEGHYKLLAKRFKIPQSDIKDVVTEMQMTSISQK